MNYKKINPLEITVNREKTHLERSREISFISFRFKYNFNLEISQLISFDLDGFYILFSPIKSSKQKISQNYANQRNSNNINVAKIPF